ncbi:unnamed protein product [marine sediment metagenome]|uniref:Uncharacterized protein n=1 Tax=marine sediment metagenome TaxID=412755 RepID=X1N355_9ZZZZ
MEPLELSKIAAKERIDKVIVSDAARELKGAVKKMEIPKPHIVFFE